MLLRKLSLVKLHGTLTLDVAFNPDITLLVGINGSGKTSVLNTIEVLLRPDMSKLATLQYERLALEFEEKGATYLLVATKSEGRVTLSISGTPEPLDPITIYLLEQIDPDDDEATERYAHLKLEPHERLIGDFLKSLSRPTIISLDRTITAETEEMQFFEVARSLSQRRARIKPPLSYVQEVTSAKYAEYRSKAISNDDELKAQIVISALQNPEMLFDGRPVKPMTKSEVGKLEEKVVSYLSGTIKSGDVAQQVKSFFASSRLLSRRPDLKSQQSVLIDFVASRYRQIDNIAKAFNDFEAKNARAFAMLREYLENVNRFFNDSNKELYFDESTGRLVFSTLTHGVRGNDKRAVTHLSSGERQILILFTFLAFASNPESVFIVDEPELSLHPKWQHEFMDAFLKLRPADAQLLLATHSPDMVGRYKSSCVTLRGRTQ